MHSLGTPVLILQHYGNYGGVDLISKLLEAG